MLLVALSADAVLLVVPLAVVDDVADDALATASDGGGPGGGGGGAEDASDNSEATSERKLSSSLTERVPLPSLSIEENNEETASVDVLEDAVLDVAVVAVELLVLAVSVEAVLDVAVDALASSSDWICKSSCKRISLSDPLPDPMIDVSEEEDVTELSVENDADVVLLLDDELDDVPSILLNKAASNEPALLVDPTLFMDMDASLSKLHHSPPSRTRA